MRYQFGDSGPHWARAVLTIAHLMNGLGARPGVLDAIGWLAGICQQLQPFHADRPRDPQPGGGVPALVSRHPR